jgi:hypothetical protein
VPTFETTVTKLEARLAMILEEGKTRLPAEMLEGGESAAPMEAATEEARTAIARALEVTKDCRGGGGDGGEGGGGATEHDVNQAVIAVHYANQKVQGVVILESWVHEIFKEEEALQAMQQAELAAIEEMKKEQEDYEAKRLEEADKVSCSAIHFIAVNHPVHIEH